MSLRGPWMSTVVLYCWCHSDSVSVLLYFTFLSHLFLCRVELVVQFPARGSTQVLLCLFPGVLWLWYFLYSVGPHPVSSLHIYTFVVSRAFTAGAASQAGDAISSRAPGLTSGLQGSVNVHRGALLFLSLFPSTLSKGFTKALVRNQRPGRPSCFFYRCCIVAFPP